MLYKISTRKYEKSFKKLYKAGLLDVGKLNSVINKLLKKEKLDKKYQDHKLKGEFSGFRECHIHPDILLIYQIRDEELVLVLINIGSHSDLFQ